mmetsp:Transcript_26090/g.60938  ORF Transcript_26090/g.60938 Transcript_26090/m.60938 type:complete len:256 (-) Transcript_26090:282-1049(-)
MLRGSIRSCRARLTCRAVAFRLRPIENAAYMIRTRLHSTVLVHEPPMPKLDFDLRAIRSELESEHARNSSASVPYREQGAPWHWIDREMSSNVAGETGAVCIYDGAKRALEIRGNISPSTLRFVEEHRAAEQQHLDLFVALLPDHKHTRLLPMWRMAGFVLGYMPTLLSDRALFLTVHAVETFVEAHYYEQIRPLQEHGRCPQLVALLQHCCSDEIHHKEDAAARAGEQPTALEQVWMGVVKLGSAVAAEAARRI